MLRSPRRGVIEQKGDGKKVEEEEIGAENHNYELGIEHS
jgi:hypothetical protein